MMIFLTKGFFSNGEIPELEIVAHEPQDIDKLVKFMLLGTGKED